MRFLPWFAALIMSISLPVSGIGAPANAQLDHPAGDPSAPTTDQAEMAPVEGEVPAASDTPVEAADTPAGDRVTGEPVAGEPGAEVPEITQGAEQLEDLSRVTALQLEEERTGIRQEGDTVVPAEQIGDPTGEQAPAEASADLTTVAGKAGSEVSEVVIDEAEVNALAKRAGCAASGGVQLPTAGPSGKEVNFYGAGWGHGAGLSQYGSLGAVRLGCNYAQILTTYFATTTIKNIPWHAPIRVEAAPNVSTMTLTADEGSIPWQVCNRDGGGCHTVATQPKGQTWVGVRDGSTFRIKRAGSTIYSAAAGRASSQRLRAVLSESNPGIMRVVDVKEARYDDGRVNRYRWGHLDLTPANSSRKGNLVLTVPSMNLYLRGLGEISSSWPVEVQKVQAVTARTFVTNKLQTRRGSEFSRTCDCDIRSSTSDQYYKGWDHEKWDTAGNWRRGIESTTHQNVVINGQPINSYFSAATGGVVTTGDFVWGGTRPAFSKRIDDSRWEQAAKFERTRWVKGFSKTELGAKLGIGVYTGHTLHGPFEPGGRIGRNGVTFRGTKGSVTLTGQDPRFKLGLHSMWFRINEGLPSIPRGLPQGPSGNSSTPPPSGGGAQSVPPAPESARPAHPMTRLAGSNRVLTAIQAAKHWPSANHVVVASEGDWHGALSAGPYAAAKNAPLLLTNSKTLNAEVAAEIRRLKPKGITLVGGHAAVSGQVEKALHSIAPVVRHAGPTAHDTAVNLAMHGGSPSNTIVVVSDTAWPDAVSASGLANGVHTPPVLFASQNAVSGNTLNAIRARRPKQILMIGGTKVLSERVRQQLASTGVNVHRLSGSNRLLTSHAVIMHSLAGGKSRVPLITASANGWADALAAGPFAARTGGRVLLVPHDFMSDSGDTARTLAATRSRWGAGFIMGGRAAVSQSVQDGLEARYRD